MEAFGTLAVRLTGMLGGLATPVALLWVAWGTLRALLGGSSDRALQQLLMRGLIAGVLLAVLNNLPATFATLSLVGNAILQAVLSAFSGAF